MKELIVLYQVKSEQTWGLYHSKEEADSEFELMDSQYKEEHDFNEVARIWIEKTPTIVFYNV